MPEGGYRLPGSVGEEPVALTVRGLLVELFGAASVGEADAQRYNRQHIDFEDGPADPDYWFMCSSSQACFGGHLHRRRWQEDYGGTWNGFTSHFPSAPMLATRAQYSECGRMIQHSHLVEVFELLVNANDDGTLVDDAKRREWLGRIVYAKQEGDRIRVAVPWAYPSMFRIRGDFGVGKGDSQAG